MRISFDLDETLFIDPKVNYTEPYLKFPYSIFFKEKLRKGTIGLFNFIKSNNHEIYIYTTSFRSPRYIKSYFKRYGLRIDGVINGEIHQEVVQKNHAEILPSKYPPKFRIKLHVDDDISVKQNGDIYGYKVVILKEDDKEWVEKVKKVITALT